MPVFLGVQAGQFSFAGLQPRHAVVAHSTKVLQRPHRRRDVRFTGVHEGDLILDRLLIEPEKDRAPTAVPQNSASIFISSPSSSDIQSLTRAFSTSGAPESPAPRGAAQRESLAQQLLQVTTEEKPQKTKNQERTPDYFANVGDAIRTLREDIPDLFQRDLNYSIYRDNIIFRDPRNKLEGIKNYKTLFWSLRFHGRIFFSRVFVEIKRIWQPTDDVIKMRWTIHGVPRVPWEAEGLFDGISTYKLDNAGRVFEHSVDNIVLRDPPMLTSPLNLVGLNLVPNMGGQAQQQPCPGAWCSSMPMPATQLQHQEPALGPEHQRHEQQRDHTNVSLWQTSAVTNPDDGMVSRAAPLDSTVRQVHEPPVPLTSTSYTQLAGLLPPADSLTGATTVSSAVALLHAAYCSTLAWVASPGRESETVNYPSSGPSSASTSTDASWSSYLGWVRLRAALNASESLLGLQGHGVDGKNGSRQLAAGSMEPSPSR